VFESLKLCWYSFNSKHSWTNLFSSVSHLSAPVASHGEVKKKKKSWHWPLCSASEFAASARSKSLRGSSKPNREAQTRICWISTGLQNVVQASIPFSVLDMSTLRRTSLVWCALQVQGVSKGALQSYFKCYCVASVTKRLHLKAYKLSMDRMDSLYVFWYHSSHCNIRNIIVKLFLKHPALSVIVSLNHNYSR
jgi:hypothetical protein